MPPAPDLGPARLAAAHRCIAPYIRRTPVLEAGGGDFGLDPSVRLVFKLELCQHSGSFKPRGAFANLLLRTIPPVGVAAASGGNHGVGGRLRRPPAEHSRHHLRPHRRVTRQAAADPELRRGARRRGRAVRRCPRRERAMDRRLRRAVRFMPSTRSRPCSAPAPSRGRSTSRRPIWTRCSSPSAVAASSAARRRGTRAKAERTCALVGVEPELAPTLTRALAAGTPGRCRGGRHRGGLARARAAWAS